MSTTKARNNIQRDEQLQVILTERSGLDITFEEAEEVGIQLVSLYECLARERSSTTENEDGHAN